MAPPSQNALASAPTVATCKPVAQPLLAPLSAVLPYLLRIDEARWYSNFGPLVTELEERLRDLAGGLPVCSVANATQGLALALDAATGGEAGLCLTPGFTFVATAHAALQAGLTPWLVDVDPTNWMLTPAIVRAALSRAPGAVKAVVVVSAFGAPVDQAGFAELARESGVPIILDAAAGFDTLGAPALPSVVSLHATKVCAAGEGGYLCAPDASLVREVRSKSNFGFAGERRAMFAATNAKISEYSAAVALAALDGWTDTRMRWLLTARKIRLAAGTSISFQHGWGQEWIGSTCVVRTGPDGAEALAEDLEQAGFQTRRWWGDGLHKEPAFVDLPREALPHVEALAASTLGIPFRIDMGDEEIREMGAILRQT